MFSPQTVYTSGPAGYVTSGQPIDVTVLAAASTGNAVGDIVAMPTPSFNIQTGEAYWLPTAQVTVPATADFAINSRKIFGVVLQAAAAGVATKVRLRGVVNGSVPASTAAGNVLQATNGTHALSVTAAGVAANNLAIAIALEATTPAAVKAVLFDGVCGFGSRG